jgi:2,3-bisphosphoglycerate-independent phosphoglycerate mutase
MNAGCVSGTGLIRGIARLTGMAVPEVPGATGYVDTDYLAKARVTLQLLQENMDFVLVHIEGIDEVSHDKNAKAKIKAIEDSSELLVRHLVENLPDDVVICILSDHTTSTLLGDHTTDPTGVIFWSKTPTFRKDDVERFTETELSKGALLRIEGKDVMPLLMGFTRRLKKFGA